MSVVCPRLGHVEPRVADGLVRAGWHVHRIGQAAYVHSPAGHFLLGVWPRRSPAPSWAARLGQPSAGWWRRLERCEREQRARLFARDDHGRFIGKLPWWRVRPPRLYRFEPAPRSLVELETARAAGQRQRWLESWSA